MKHTAAFLILAYAIICPAVCDRMTGKKLDLYINIKKLKKCNHPNGWDHQCSMDLCSQCHQPQTH